MSRAGLSALFVSNGRLRTAWRVALYLLGYFVALFATQIPITLLYVGYLMSVGTATLADVQTSLLPDRLPLWLHVVFKAAELAVLLPLTYAASRWLDRRRLGTLGLRPDRGALLDVLVGLALGALQMALVFGFEWANGWLSVRVLSGAQLVRGLTDAGIAFALFVLVAVGEELMFRGYLQTNLQEGTGSLLALLLTSLAFAIFHALNPNLSWMAVLNLALAGLALGYGRLVTGKLWLPMAYHFAWNYCQGAVLGLPVSGVRYGGLLAVADQSAVRWLTGTSFGPEGGLVGTVILLSAFPTCWLWGRLRRRLLPAAPGPA